MELILVSIINVFQSVKSMTAVSMRIALMRKTTIVEIRAIASVAIIAATMKNVTTRRSAWTMNALVLNVLPIVIALELILVLIMNVFRSVKPMTAASMRIALMKSIIVEIRAIASVAMIAAAMKNVTMRRTAWTMNVLVLNVLPIVIALERILVSIMNVFWSVKPMTAASMQIALMKTIIVEIRVIVSVAMNAAATMIATKARSAWTVNAWHT